MGNYKKGTKEIKPYGLKNLIKVEGKGKKSAEICQEYIELIRNGYSLTVSEVADYLRCTYQYVNLNIVPEVKHIRITEAAKRMLLSHTENEYIEQEIYTPLFYKRILLNKEDFERYIADTTIYVESYKRFYKKDFDSNFLNNIQNRLTVYNQNTFGKDLSINSFMQKVMNTFLWEDFKNDEILSYTKRHYYDELYSQKDLMNVYGYEYKSYFYRKLEAEGINKIHINNLVRYPREELTDTDYLAVMPVTAYNYLVREHSNNSIKVIQERAIEMVEN